MVATQQNTLRLENVHIVQPCLLGFKLTFEKGQQNQMRFMSPETIVRIKCQCIKMCTMFAILRKSVA